MNKDKNFNVTVTPYNKGYIIKKNKVQEFIQQKQDNELLKITSKRAKTFEINNLQEKPHTLIKTK